MDFVSSLMAATGCNAQEALELWNVEPNIERAAHLFFERKESAVVRFILSFSITFSNSKFVKNSLTTFMIYDVRRLRRGFGGRRGRWTSRPS